MRIVALGGIAGPVLFTVVVTICGALRPGYGHMRQFISELGATGTPHALLMNLAGFITGGLFLTGFGIATTRLVPATRRSAVATGLVTVFGLGMIVAGIFSCDPGCPDPPRSLAATIHRAATLRFVAGIAGTALWALEFRRSASLHGLWKYSMATAVAALGLLLLFLGSVPHRAMSGLWQRLLVAVLFVWCGLVAARLQRAPSSR